MKIKTLFYQKTFPLQAYANEKIGIEVELDETDDLDTVFQELKTKVERLHIENMPVLVASNPIIEQVQQIKEPPKPKLSPEETMINEINTCKELKVLESYRLIVKKNPKYQEIYDRKLKELTDGK